MLADWDGSMRITGIALSVFPPAHHASFSTTGHNESFSASSNGHNIRNKSFNGSHSGGHHNGNNDQGSSLWVSSSHAPEGVVGGTARDGERGRRGRSLSSSSSSALLPSPSAGRSSRNSVNSGRERFQQQTPTLSAAGGGGGGNGTVGSVFSRCARVCVCFPLAKFFPLLV